MVKIPPSPPFAKGGLGGFESYWFEAGFNFWLLLCRPLTSVVKFLLFHHEFGG